ncbi:MAG: hypothetical protein KGZ59_00520 [Chitinophagaceae bacterium]|nr:hypothetical protein [Chitinophagaceae bacterium]
MSGISSKAESTLANKYKSNGGTELESKEFSDGSGLDWLATDFRSYDPQIGRFHQIDFLATLSLNQSPFAFVNNNPINFIDPLGLDTLKLNDDGSMPTTRADGSNLQDVDVILGENGQVANYYNGESWQAPEVLEEVVVSNNSPVNIQYGANANQRAVTEHSLAILRDIMKESFNPTITITSTQRTPQDQARAMYNNIISRGVQYNLNLYGANGDRVVNVAANRRRQGKTREEILSAMAAEIRRIGPGRVSRHCGDPNVLNVLDISPSSLLNRRAFVREIRERGIFLLQPPADPAYHLEIPQL